MAWLLERPLAHRIFEVRNLDFTQQLIQLDVNALSISISADEVKQIEAITEPARQSAKELYSKYRPSQNNGERRDRIGLDGDQGEDPPIIGPIRPMAKARLQAERCPRPIPTAIVCGLKISP